MANRGPCRVIPNNRHGVLGPAPLGSREGCTEGELLSQQKRVISEALYKKMSCKGLGRGWENLWAEDGHLYPHQTAGGGMETTAKDPVTPTSWSPELTNKGQRGPCSCDYVGV